MITKLSRTALRAFEPNTLEIPKVGFGRIRGSKPQIAGRIAVPSCIDDEVGSTTASNARTKGVNPPMASGACPFSKFDNLKSAGYSMISSITSEEGGAKETLPRHFCKYSSQSPWPYWVAKGYRMAAIQSSLCTISLLIQIITQSARLWTCAQSTLQSNRSCLSSLSQNKQITQTNPGVSIPLRSRWLSWTKARKCPSMGMTMKRNLESFLPLWWWHSHSLLDGEEKGWWWYLEWLHYRTVSTCCLWDPRHGPSNGNIFQGYALNPKMVFTLLGWIKTR